ncbi:MAG: hypothetical protein Q9179_006256 [Wetmoreana sp. 5 TL-2023]
MPGIPGMGMDQMQAMSQGMYGGFGGPGMGMNGMNAGMGFPAGQGWNGGFNGQPGAWMSGQDKFNQNAYGGQASGMSGDFGGNAGYAGYNMPSHQGNFNQMNHHQFPNHDFQNGYHGQGFSNRGRGRGRGYSYAPRGRGGYNQVMPGNHTNNEPFHHQIPPQLAPQDNSYSQAPHQSHEAEKQTDFETPEVGKRITAATDEQIARELAPGDADESAEAPATKNSEAAPVHPDQDGETSKHRADDVEPSTISKELETQHEQKAENKQQNEQPVPIEAFVSDEQNQAEPSHPSSAVVVNTMMPPPTSAVPQPSQFAPLVESPQEYSARGRGSDRRLSRGSYDFRGAGRGRGGPAYLSNGNTNHVLPVSQPPQPAPAAPIEPKGLGVVGAPKGPKAMREGLPNTGIRGGRGFSIVGRASAAVHGRANGQARSRSRSSTRSRSPSRHRSHHHRSHRHRSRSASVDSDREERRRERHRRRPRKYDDEDEEMQDYTGSSSRRSSHRSRRERDEGRDDDEGRKSHHRSHRSRRDRSKDGESRSIRKRSRTPTEIIENAPHSSSTSSSRKRREREEDDESRRDRKRSKRDEYSDAAVDDHRSDIPSSKHRNRHSESERHSTTTSKPPSAPKNHYQLPAQKAAEIDPHELERQARNKERMQKELQRREAMEGKGPSRKESGHKSNGGGLGRRVSYKYEDELEGHDIEREREAGRWGR